MQQLNQENISTTKKAKMSTSSFDKIPNFRDVGQTVNESQSQELLKTGLFFRSARPDDATKRDRERLVNEYGIKTIMDLRTTTEHINAAKKRSELAALAQPAIAPTLDSLVLEPLEIPNVKYANINLNGPGFERSLLWQLSYLSIAKVIGYMAFGYRMEAIGIIGREVLQPRGLIGLGIDTLRHSGKEIKQVFDTLADEESWPIMVHCTQGKDRTGIVVVLVLLLCGIDIDAITIDYVRTELELGPEFMERRAEVGSIGLDESFTKCPRDFPQKVQEYIKENYGSIQDYLRGLGIGEEKLQRVRSILETGKSTQ